MKPFLLVFLLNNYPVIIDDFDMQTDCTSSLSDYRAAQEPAEGKLFICITQLQYAKVIAARARIDAGRQE